MQEQTEAAGGRTRKRQSSKPPARSATPKVKATIHLSASASQRLSVHAAMTGMDRSEVVESLIEQHLKRFVVSDRAKAGSANDEEANGAGKVWQ